MYVYIYIYIRVAIHFYHCHALPILELYSEKQLKSRVGAATRRARESGILFMKCVKVNKSGLLVEE